MKKNKMKVLTLALIFFGIAPFVCAGYNDSVKADSGTVSSSSGITDIAAGDSSKASSAEMNTRSKEGTVTLVNADMIKVKDSKGKEMTAAIEPNTSTAWKNGKEVGWNQITRGNEVNVEFIDTNGAKTVKTVQCI